MIYAYDGNSVYVASIAGQKIEMMRENSHVCFEVDTYAAAGWRSAIVQGVFEELEEADIPTALALLAQRFGRDGAEGHPRRRRETHGRPTVCFRIDIQTVTGRAIRRPPQTFVSRSASRRPTRTT